MQSEQTIESAAKAVQAKLSNGRVQAAFDPMIVIKIADVLIEIVKQCRAGREQLVASAARPRFFDRLRVRRIVRSTMTPAEWRSHGSETVEAIFEAAAEAGTGEIAAIVEAVDSL